MRAHRVWQSGAAGAAIGLIAGTSAAHVYNWPTLVWDAAKIRETIVLALTISVVPLSMGLGSAWLVRTHATSSGLGQAVVAAIVSGLLAHSLYNGIMILAYEA